MDDLTPDDWSSLDKHGRALYELRLVELGPMIDRDDRERCVRRWASCALGEAMCVLELEFGLDKAHELAQAMLDRRHEYTGPRTRRVRQ